MFPLLETIRIQDGAAQNLLWHTRRMEASYVELFGTKCPFDLGEITESRKWPDGLIKARFLYGKDDFRIESETYSPKEINSLKIIRCDNIDYHLKYSSRDVLDRLGAGKGGADDILIVKNGFVTDTSFANIIFFDGEFWYTARTPLLKGTCRERLLNEQIIKERDIRPEDLSCFSRFMLINAMLDFDAGSAKPVSVICCQ